MDKLIKTLKNRILLAYVQYVKRSQRGRPLENYSDILDAMIAIDYISSFSVTDEQKIKILEYYILKLNNG